MNIEEIQNNPAYHISYNPAFLIVKQDSDYMFYNSVNHKAFRLNNIEFELLNLLYTYEDREYVFSLFEGDVKTEVVRLAEIIEKLGMLDLESVSDLEHDYKVATNIPSTYYIHLTNDCNLNCTYCYNQEWRKHRVNPLSYNEWEQICSKIIPFAKTIVLTGGEFLLVPFVPKLVKFIKEHNPTVIIEGLSNGCLDYSRDYILKTLNYLDKITLSCDSLNSNDERVGFNKTNFLNNVRMLKKYYPRLKIAIATTLTTKNYMSIGDIRTLCKTYGLEWRKTEVCPSSPKDTVMMVDLGEQVNRAKESRQHQSKTNTWFTKQIRCGAAKSVCSINAVGEVYPCQALHYEEFDMGNLLISEIKDLKYIKDSSHVVPSVDDLMPCKVCKVKYICGGGCFANRFAYNKTGRYSSLFCPMRYENSISMLLSLDNKKMRVDL